MAILALPPQNIDVETSVVVGRQGYR